MAIYPHNVFRSPAGLAECEAVYEAALAAWPVAYERRHVATRFGRTHVIVSGAPAAPPLVLMPGNWATATMWSTCIAALSQAYRTFAVDILGDLGLSTPSQLPANRRDYAAWLQEVLDGLGLERVPIAGLSYGGFLALNLALAAPTRVSRLVLLCPGLPCLAPPTQQWALYGAPMILLRAPWTVRWFIRGVSTDVSRDSDAEVEQLTAAVRHLRNLTPVRPEIEAAELAALQAPVLLLIGEKEILYPAHAAVAHARQLFPQIEAEVVPGAGHMLTHDQPQVVTARMLKFLQCA